MSKIGRYEIAQQLGEGTHLARDSVLGRKVVVRTGAKPDIAKKASEVSHPSLAMILDMGEDPELGPFLVYEYVGGPTLRQRIPEVISPSEIAKIATEIAGALAAVHEAGLAHGAVKPENVRFSKSGAKLVGLGLHEGSAEDDQRALAALVYETFARKPAGDPPVPLADLDDARSPLLRARIDAALSRAFSKDPKKLYPTCRDLGTMIAGAIDPPHSGAFPMLRAAELEALSRVSIVPKPVRRAQNVFAGLAVIVIVLLVIFGRRSGREQPQGAPVASMPPPHPSASARPNDAAATD
jgi:serine/threonine-protein kinase